MHAKKHGTLQYSHRHHSLYTWVKAEIKAIFLQLYCDFKRWSEEPYRCQDPWDVLIRLSSGYNSEA